MLTYLQNLVKLQRGDFTLSPRLAVYYVTMQCNLNCAYCEDFGSRRNHQLTPNPGLETAKQILKIIRSGMDHLWMLLHGRNAADNPAPQNSYYSARHVLDRQ